MTEETRPEVSYAGIVYGEIIYWGTVAGSIIAIIGATIATLFTKNVIEPAYLFSQIWEGNSPATIWEGAVGATPKGHWYLANLFTGDGLAMFGLAFGVFAVTPGLNPAVVKEALSVALPLAPGVMTPTDVEAALALGVKLLKFFPAHAAGGTALLKSIYAP